MAKILTPLTAYEAAPDPATRSDLLDELQDSVGLAGKMVLDNDIVKKAKQLLAG